MSTDTWIEDNRVYLASSMAWLRLRLATLVAEAGTSPAASAPPLEPAPDAFPERGPAPPAAAPAPAARGWFGARDKAPASSLFAPARGAVAVAPAAPSTPQAPAGAIVLPAGVLVATVAAPPPDPPRLASLPALEAAAQARALAAQASPPPALIMLQQRFRLTDFERDTLLLAAAVDLDPSLAGLVAQAQGSPGAAFASFALALRALDDASWDALSPQHPLRRARLLDAAPTAGLPLAAGPLRVDERIVNFLHGLNALDERCAALVSPVGSGDADALAATQQQVAQAVLARLRAGPADGALPAVVLLGTDTASKQAVAAQVCEAVGRRLYAMGADALPHQRAEADALARLWQRESALMPIALYLDAEALDLAQADAAAPLQAFVGREPGLVFVGLRELPASPSLRMAFDVAKPTPVEQSQAWEQSLAPALGAGAAAAAEHLAGQFDFNLAEIRQAATQAQAAGAEGAVDDRAWQACCGLARPRMEALTQRLEAGATWNDLVLPDEAARLLAQVVTQVRNRFRVYEQWGWARRTTRGRGISVLFAGESGTGKTMAAEVLANALALDLYRIDLSAVVSKYIGETEKNLRRLFDAAELGGAILFFDEADALFGKRSEVKDSHDRYANIEINYLLQRMESFRGLAILSTNLKSALDPAFMRRLRFIVNFPFPGPAQRREMWAKAFPSELPTQALDLDRLSRFNLSGGNIHSIALNAAFAAAQRGGPVTQPLLLAAVRTELRKLDKPVNEAEFR